MRLNFLAPFLVAALALIFSGCDGGRAQMEKNEANALGIIKYEDDNYSPSGVSTFAVSTNELYDRDNVGGKKVTLLWGLITLKDY